MTSAPIQIGVRLDSYELLEIIGSGGMASVYRALDHNLRRQVAIKILSAQAMAQPGFSGRFVQEARLIASLRHPNIVQVYDFGEQAGYAYIVMELLPGPTLERQLHELAAQGAHMERAQVLAVVRQLAAALAAAHAAGIIHRDLKPSNAIWNSAGALVLTDFGIAKDTTAAVSQTEAGMVLGTPGYLSPEQAQGLTLTPASDIYSLGIVLYELIAGRLPFDANTPMRVLLSHIQQPPPPLRAARPDLPAAVEGVVQRALAKSPAARFATPGELADALDRAWPSGAAAVLANPDLHSQPTVAWQVPAPARPAQPPPPPAATQPGPATPTATPPQARRTSRALLLVAGVLALLILGAAGLAFRNSSGDLPSEPTAAVVVPPTSEPPPAPSAAPPAPTSEPPPAPSAAPPAPTSEPPPAPSAAPPAPTSEPPPPAEPERIQGDYATVRDLRTIIDQGAKSSQDGGLNKKLVDLWEGFRKAVAKGDKRQAENRLRQMQQEVLRGVEKGDVARDFAQQMLDQVAAVAQSYKLDLASAQLP